MRVRHLAVVLVGVVLAGLALWTFGLGASGKGPTLINPEDGTINVAVTQAGSGTWVPYLITVRNLGTQPFTGEVLLVNRPGLLPSAASVIQAGSLPSAPTLSGPSSAPPPDSAYEVSLQLDARHKRTVSFYAPSAYTHAEVFDELGNLVAGPVPVDAHGSYLLGLLSDSDALEQELGTVRIGDLPARATRFDDASFPRRPVYLSGLLTIVMAHFQSARLSPEQIHALRDFVGFGGSLVIAGGPDLGTVARALPPELVPLAPGGSTTVAGLGPVGELAGLTANPLGQVATGTLVPGARVVLASPEGTRWRLVWSSGDPRYGGTGMPEPETAEHNWVLPAHSAACSRCPRASFRPHLTRRCPRSGWSPACSAFTCCWSRRSTTWC